MELKFVVFSLVASLSTFVAANLEKTCVCPCKDKTQNETEVREIAKKLYELLMQLADDTPEEEGELFTETLKALANGTSPYTDEKKLKQCIGRQTPTVKTFGSNLEKKARDLENKLTTIAEFIKELMKHYASRFSAFSTTFWDLILAGNYDEALKEAEKSANVTEQVNDEVMTLLLGSNNKSNQKIVTVFQKLNKDSRQKSRLINKRVKDCLTKNRG